MLTLDEEKHILTHAYVPEHSVGLMTCISGGEPFLIENYFVCCKEDWIIIVGYPLENGFSVEKFENVFAKIIKRFRPRYVSLVAPELPKSLAANCRESEIDHYYTLKTQNHPIHSGLRRIIKKAQQVVSVEHSTSMGSAHHELSQEFIERIQLPARVRGLLFKMPEFVGHADHSFVLNAWDQNNNLTAFYVVDLAAKNFSSYVIGGHSKSNYVSGASDLLFFELIKVSMECNKDYIHLGLGVNQGIRRFKEKWGGLPTRKYEMCELVLKKPSIIEFITSLGKFR